MSGAAAPPGPPAPDVALIAAIAANGVIGRDNRLPWHLPADLKRFKALTLSHALVVGRRTYESIGRPLPGRHMVVLTHREGYAPEGVTVARSLPAALAAGAAAAPGEVFVAGGAEVYAQALPMASRLYLTRVEAEVPGDARFPPFDPADWRLVSEERHSAADAAPFAYSFQVWERA